MSTETLSWGDSLRHNAPDDDHGWSADLNEAAAVRLDRLDTVRAYCEETLSDEAWRKGTGLDPRKDLHPVALEAMRTVCSEILRIIDPENCEACGLELTDDERQGATTHECPEGFRS